MSEMRGISRLNDLRAFKNAVDSFLSCSFADWSEQPMEPLTVTQWTPRAVSEWILLVDIIENNSEYLIRAELPGVDKGDVKVTEDRGILTILGERKSASDELKSANKQNQDFCVSFGRKFSIPDDARPAKISVEFKEGVLRVRLAKNGKTRSRKGEAAIA